MFTKSDKNGFMHQLKEHQKRKTDYIVFCNACAETGIEKWVVHLDAMTCTHFNKLGNEILVEHTP